MDIASIYKKYAVTPNLAEHMQTVTYIVELIQKHWIGPKIDWQEMIIIAQLHDIGNIVKFDFVKYPDLLGSEKINIQHWQEKQKGMIEKYGSDDHLATENILREIGINQHIINVIINKSFANTIKIISTDDCYTKILAYADLRVLPSGIGTVGERIEDIKVRMPKYSQRTDFMDLVTAAYELESQIQQMVDISLTEFIK